MTKKLAAMFFTFILVLSSGTLSGCSESDNSAVVGEWTPSTVSIGGTTVPYSELDTKNRDFCLQFYEDGKCDIKIGGVSNRGTYTFNQTSLDIEYGGKSKKLSYDHGVLTLKLDYNNKVTLYMFTRVTK